MICASMAIVATLVRAPMRAAPLARHSMPIMSGEATRLFKARDAR